MKKIVSILALVTCVFALTACGASGSSVNGDPISADEESQWVMQGESLVQSLDQIYQNGQEAQLEDDPIYGPAIDSWASAQTDIGQILGYQNEYAVQSDKNQITINIGVDGSDHDADVVIIVKTSNSGVEPTSVTTNVQYSFGELMQQAGLNTLLGMGTTFVVLIILALLISLFAYIPKIQKALSRKKEAPVAEPVKAVASPVVSEPETDDNELIAVIAAAIAASEGRTSTDGFVVRSIRKSRKKF